MAVELEVRVSDIPKTARALRREAGRLQRRITDAAHGVITREFLPKLKALTPAFMPKSHGYAALLARDLEVRTAVRFTGPMSGVSAFVSAPTGGPNGRAVKDLERGTLRHPLFANRGYWYRNRKGVKAGLAKTALKSTKGRLVDGIDHEIQKIMADVVRG